MIPGQGTKTPRSVWLIIKFLKLKNITNPIAHQHKYLNPPPTARQKENLEEWHYFIFMLPSLTSGSLEDGGILHAAFILFHVRHHIIYTVRIE